MHHTRKSIVSLLQLLLLSICLLGCATASKEEIAKVDFGSAPTNYESNIKNLVSRMLKDPYSATYHFSSPRKGVVQEGLLLGMKKYFGWIVPVGINAKNSFGGYVGEKTYYFLFANGMVYDVTSLMQGGSGRFVD